MTERRAGLLSRLLLLAVSLLLGLRLCELLARQFFSPPPMIRFGEMTQAAGWEGERRSIGDAFAPDIELFWRLAPDVVLPASDGALRGIVSNAQGL